MITAFLVSCLYLLVKLIVIWGVAYIIKIVVDWAPFIPVPIKAIIWYAIVIVAAILSLIAAIEVLQIALSVRLASGGGSHFGMTGV